MWCVTGGGVCVCVRVLETRRNLPHRREWRVGFGLFNHFLFLLLLLLLLFRVIADVVVGRVSNIRK